MSNSDADSFVGRMLKVLSAEFLVISLGGLLTFYGGYRVLADDQAEQAEQINKMEQRQESNQQALQMIGTDVEIIKNNQKHFREALEGNRATVQRIREILEKQHR